MSLSHSSLTPRSKKQGDDNMIPLINIIFLLLIFYLVAVQIQASLLSDLQLPEQNDKVSHEPAATILQISADNEAFLNGKQVSVDELVAYFDALEKEAIIFSNESKAVERSEQTPDLQKTVSRQQHNKDSRNEMKNVNIYADHRLTAKQLDEWLLILREQSIDKIELISEQAL